MLKTNITKYIMIGGLAISYTACKIPQLQEQTENKTLPAHYDGRSPSDSITIADISWRRLFSDPFLIALVDTALANNQELNITSQEIDISRNEIRARKGEYLPFVGLKAGVGADKVPRYTNIGALEATTDIKPGKEMPEPLGDFGLAAYASWELDIWHRLRNATKSAVHQYLSTREGKNFMVTRLVSEIARSYYELLALDNQLEILNGNIGLQTNALKIVRLQKESTRVTELAVKRFEAQLLNTESMQYAIRQQIVETENRINYLLGRYPRPIVRNKNYFEQAVPEQVKPGMPAQLLANRPDIRQEEQKLAASRLDVKVARARFYPSLGISAGLGYRAFNPAYLVKTPESLLYSLAGDLTAPLVNRNAIKATYFTANAKQIQAVYEYEQIILKAYMEVANELSRIDKLKNTYSLKERQVAALSQSVDVSNSLFTSARADYMEVLLTQREALEARFDLVEIKMRQFSAWVNLYQALGGGWK